MSMIDAPPTVVTTTNQPGATVTLVTTLLVPLVTILGLIVLMGLHDVDQTAGLAIISGLAGVHGGVTVANAVNTSK